MLPVTCPLSVVEAFSRKGGKAQLLYYYYTQLIGGSGFRGGVCLIKLRPFLSVWLEPLVRLGERC